MRRPEENRRVRPIQAGVPREPQYSECSLGGAVALAPRSVRTGTVDGRVFEHS